jgi:hypothetical protein
MTDYRFTKELLAKALAAKTGHEPADTLEFVGTLLEIAQLHGLITAERLAQHERDATCYELRTRHNIPAADIAKRFGVGRITVHMAIQKQLKIRRAG